MNRIDEMINWYKENASRREYTLIKAKLKLIKSLLDEIENSEDRIFILPYYNVIQNMNRIKIFVDGLLWNPEKDQIMFTSIYNDELDLNIRGIKTRNVTIEYNGYYENVICNSEVGKVKVIADNKTVIDLSSYLQYPFDIYNCRMYIDGYRVPEYAIKHIGDNAIIEIDNLKFDVNDNSELIIYQQVMDENIYAYTSKDQFLNEIYKEDERFRKYLLEKYGF